mgnify:CR=1 FL=1
MRKCICKENYEVSMMDYLENGKHSEIYNQIIFEKDKEYYYSYSNKNDVYYVSNKTEHLKRIDYFCDYVYDMKYDEFNKHFKEIK